MAAIWLTSSAGVVVAQTVVQKSGLIHTDETWPAGNLYLVTGDVTIAAGASLTIAGGVVVKFRTEGGACRVKHSLIVDGDLRVMGSAGAPVVFTSSRDDSTQGDTNGDGTATLPDRRDWQSIRFNPGSTGEIRHAQIRYGGGVSNDCSAGVGTIFLDASSPTIDQITARELGWSAISARPTDRPKITGLTASRTPIGGLEMRGGTLTNEGVWDQADVVYVPTGNIAVNEGAVLTIGAGVVVKFHADGGSCRVKHSLRVNGTLNIEGTAEQPVVLTSLRDDAVRGDTNGDDLATTAQARDWQSIRFEPGSTGSIRHAQARYGGGVSDSCSEVIGTFFLDGSSPSFDHLAVRDVGWSALSARPTDRPRVTNFQASRSPIGGLEMRGGAMTTDGVWDQRDVIYVPSGNITVNANATLEIHPGVAVKFLAQGSACRSKRSILVDGSLSLLGTADEPVVLSSSFDDALRGDTNGDNDATEAAPRDWQSIAFRAGSRGTIHHTQVRYAGGVSDSCSNVVGTFVLDGSSPSFDSLSASDLAWSVISADPSDHPRVTNFQSSRSPIGGIEVRGATLLGDAVWDQTDAPYVPSGNVTIAPNASLQVAPGVAVKFLALGSGCREKFSIIVQGSLTVTGRADRKVFFTSSRDDTVLGDTNGDRSNSIAEARDWQSIRFAPGSFGNIEGAEVRFGGGVSGSCSANVAAVQIDDASPAILGSTIRSNTIGLAAAGLSARLRINHSNIIGNSVRAIESRDGAVVDARNNWWGVATGPAQNAVMGNVDTAGFLGFPAGAATPTPSPSPTPTPPRCAGDCNGNRRVEMEEIILGVQAALGKPSAPSCGFDPNDDQQVTIEELVAVAGDPDPCR